MLSLGLGGNCRLHVHENNEVFIKDLDTKKCTFFTPPRWKLFVGLIANTEEQVQLSLVGITTNYIQHIGGTWHVTVDSKFPTVDIRRWYEDSRAGSSLKPTRVGIALTYSNWAKLKKAIVEVENEILVMRAVSPCWHDGQIDEMFCDECSPYRKLECVADIRAAESAEKLTIDTDSGDGDVDFMRCR